MKHCEKTNVTFRREEALLVTGAVDKLNIELLRDGIDRGDLVGPCTIVDDHAVRVGRVLLVCEEAHSLDKCTFNLCESRTMFRGAECCLDAKSAEVVFVCVLTWPKSTAGFRLCPQSYTRSLRRIVVAPVKTSTSTCDGICNVVSAFTRSEAVQFGLKCTCLLSQLGSGIPH
jgi:hypothetical protein